MTFPITSALHQHLKKKKRKKKARCPNWLYNSWYRPVSTTPRVRKYRTKYYCRWPSAQQWAAHTKPPVYLWLKAIIAHLLVKRCATQQSHSELCRSQYLQTVPTEEHSLVHVTTVCPVSSISGRWHGAKILESAGLCNATLIIFQSRGK